MSFNASAAAIRHQQLTLFFVLAVAVAGLLAYFKLGQREDPDFTFRAVTIRTLWPGATSSQVDDQITNRIEKKLQEMPYFKRTQSYSKSGESLIILELEDNAPKREVPQFWYQARKKIGDIRHTLPAEAIGPFYNDEFGDVFGSIYAFTGDGFTLGELRDKLEDVRQELLRTPDISKVELVGVQDERIYVEISNSKIASLGVDASQIALQLQAQNALAPAGTIQNDTHAIPLRVSGNFDSVREVRELLLSVTGGKLIRLGDIASVYRGLADPPFQTVRFKGQPAIAVAVSMKSDGDVLQLGRNLDAAMARIRADLALGIEFEQVSDQPRIVKQAVGTFMTSLLEAIAIVLLVSFVSLGWRAGAVVALTIPFVLLATFLVMSILRIDLHRISTGALIIALGLLVDDAMIVVEMMVRKLEEGFDKFASATFAYVSTAWPMLSGTLVTAAGFLPIAMAKSATGEYTFDMFSVTTIALVLSWFAAILVTPLFGYWILRSTKAVAGRERQRHRKERAAPRALRHALLQAPARADRLVHHAPLDHHRRHRGGPRVGWSRHGPDREAVLPHQRPQRSDGRDVAARRLELQGNRDRGRQARGVPAQGPRREDLRDERRQLAAALLPVAEPGAVPAELRALADPHARRRVA